MSGLSSKVALSALETHGRVDALLANESTLPIGEVLEASKVEAVRAVFRRLVGAQTLEKMEATVAIAATCATSHSLCIAWQTQSAPAVSTIAWKNAHAT